ITNAINIASELSGSSLDVILTGGTLRSNSYSLVGPIAEESLRRLKADILFLGVDGFDTQSGVSTPNLLEAQLNRLMVQSAARVIADKQIPRQHLRALKKAGIETILV